MGGGLQRGRENERNAASDFYYVCVHLDANGKLIFVFIGSLKIYEKNMKINACILVMWSLHKDLQELCREH